MSRQNAAPGHTSTSAASESAALSTRQDGAAPGSGEPEPENTGSSVRPAPDTEGQLAKETDEPGAAQPPTCDSEPAASAAAAPPATIARNGVAVPHPPARPGDPGDPARPRLPLGTRLSVTKPPAKPRSPGGTIAGRYRLLSQVGRDTSVNAEFWRARDIVLERDVALTLLQDTGDPDNAARATDMISRGLRWGRFEHIGCARLLDVMRNDNGGLPKDVLGLAVTEWVPGKTLAEMVAAGPLRTGSVLAMLDPLAEAAEAAHRQGLVLGCAHPQRVRFGPDARLAFALPHPDATPAEDVRGLGALLYALLTAHWPLSDADAELSGLPAAPLDVQHTAVPPNIVRPGISVEVSALATGAIGAGATHGRVHTAAAVHKVISGLLESDSEAALLPPPDDGAPASDDEVWQPDTVPEPTPDPERKRKLSIGMGGLGVGVLAVVGYVGVELGQLLGVAPSSPPKIVVTSPPPVAAQASPAAQPPPLPAPAVPAPAPDAPTPSVVVPIASAQVFDPSGDPDNPGRLNRAFDNDPSSGWSTYDYRAPFPLVKPGVGVMVSFAAPVQLSSLTILSPSKGTVLQIRSAPTPNAPFNQTVQIGDATISQQSTTVSLTGSQPVQNVLLWITKLGGGGDQNVTQINDLHFERVAD